MFDFIESCLRHKSEMVIYEAAQAIVQLKNTTAKDLAPAVSVLQLFCSSPKPTLRFAAVRTLNKVGSASLIIVIIMYICPALINTLSAHMIHINLNTIVNRAQPYQNNLHKVLYGKTNKQIHIHT